MPHFASIMSLYKRKVHLIMQKIKVLALSFTLFGTTSIYAQTTTENKTTPYGDNPNIFKVIAKKTGSAVQNTAEKVGEATENGIRKIKPKFDETIDNTKTYTAEQATIAKENTQKGIDTAVKKVEQTTDRVLGRTEYNVPIEQGSLSQSKIPTKTAYEVTAATPTTTVLSTLTPIAQPTTVQNTQVEPEIVKQSLPIENTTTKQTENSSTKASNEDDTSGVPR